MTNDPIYDTEGYIKKCYKFLNGKINPYYPARRLLLVNRDIDFAGDKDSKFVINGEASLDTVKIFPDRISGFLDKYRFNELDVGFARGYLIGIVAHELSHLDQYIPWYAFAIEDGEMVAEDLALHYEMMNDLNTIRFMTKYMNDISYELGNYSAEFYEQLSNYLTDADGNRIQPLPKYAHIPYRKITSRVERFWNTMGTVCLCDLEKLCDDYDIESICLMVKNSFSGDDLVFTIYTDKLKEPESNIAIQTEEDLSHCLSKYLYIGCCWDAKMILDENKNAISIIFDCIGGDSDLYESGTDTFRAYYERTGFNKKKYGPKSALKRVGLL
jgi:hypothetical protein